MAMIGKIRRMHLRDKKSVSEIARSDEPVAQHGSQVAARRRRRGAPTYRREPGPTKLTPFAEALEQALQGRRASAEDRSGARPGRCSSEIRRGRLRWRLLALTDFIRDWRHGRRRRGCGQGFRAADVRARRSVPVRLERRRPGDRRHLPQGAGGAHEAVREPRVLAGGLPEPGSRDAVRCAHALASRRSAALPGAASTTT